MFELICKISFFLFMLVLYAYLTSTSEVIIIIFGYICCVFSYHYFRTIKTAIDDLLNYVQNYGIFKTNLGPPHVPNYTANKKYNKVNNAVNVPTLNNKIFVPVCRNNNVFSSSTPAVFNCKFNNFIMNGDLPSPIMPNGLFVESSSKSREKMKSPMQNIDKTCNSSTLRFRKYDSKSVHNPFTAKKKYNNNLDMETYMNVKSPGFTSRIVDKAMESASYHIKYPAVKQISTYRFDKSTLRHLSKIPRMNFSPLVRIAPPEPISIHLLNDMEKKLDKNEPLEPNFLQVLKDISRKRNFSQEETEKSSGTAKKSRKNDIKNLTISQYKRSLEDKSRGVLDDKIKKRCEDHEREAAKMVVYAPSIATTPDRNTQSYSKKRKSNKSNNEYQESTEKCRRIHKSFKEVCSAENLSEQKPRECNLRSSDPPSANESKLMDNSDQRFKQSRDELVEDDDIEYVRVASGKILNRTNRPYRRKLNSNKIDPVSVIASEPEIVGEINGTDDMTMKEHLLQNLLSDIERKGHKDQKVIFYENSILTDVAKNHTKYEEPPQQVPNPLFIDSVVPNGDEIEMTDLVNDELKESSINTCHSRSIASYATAAMFHSTPIISNAVSNDTNRTIPSKVFGSGSFINVSNKQNSTDSGYDTFNSSREQICPFTTSTTLSNSYDILKFNSTNENAFKLEHNSKAAIPSSSAFSFNHSSDNLFSVPWQTCSVSRHPSFAQLNGANVSNTESNPKALFGSNSTSLFGSGDGNFFNHSSRQFSPLSVSISSPMGDRNENLCNFGVSSKIYSNTFGCKDGTSMQYEPSFSSITTEYQKKAFEFKNGEIGSAAGVTFNMGSGGSLRNHAARNTRKK